MSDCGHEPRLADEQRDVAAKPTSNTAAYEAYLRGLAADQQTEYSAESISHSRAYYQQAVQLDPNFAEAWRSLAQAISPWYSNEPDRSPADLAAMREAAAAVARLKPDSGDAWLAQGYYRYRGLRDRPGALEAWATGSTEQALMRDVHRSLLRGAKHGAIVFGVRGVDGQRREVTLTRSVSADDPRLSALFRAPFPDGRSRADSDLRNAVQLTQQRLPDAEGAPSAGSCSAWASSRTCG